MTLPAVDRIYGQYRSKPKAVSWFNIIPTVGNEICAAYEQIRTSYSIDLMSGANLDTIGEIVQIGRGFESLVEMIPNQFGGDNDQFGDQNVQFSSADGAVSNEVNDQIYRLLIKAKIVKNNSEAQIDDVIKAALFITGVNAQVVDNEDMSFSLVFNGQLDDITRIALTLFDVIPRPQGVEFVGFTESVVTPSSPWFDNYFWNDNHEWVD